MAETPRRKSTSDAKEIMDKVNDGNDPGALALQKMLDNDRKTFGFNRILIVVLIAVIVLFSATIIWNNIRMSNIDEARHNAYIQETKDFIAATNTIQTSSDWERLPVNQKREILMDLYLRIVNLYTIESSEAEKMTDDQIIASFNQLWLCTERLPHVNFFLPIAYMKVATNFNPNFDEDWKRGMASLYLQRAENISNLPLVRNDEIFRTTYQGLNTVNNPVEAMKLLVAEIDDLSVTFNNRVDWILLALISNEYDVISEYWNDGTGAIPDTMYESGELAEMLKFYHAFSALKIPMEYTEVVVNE